MSKQNKPKVLFFDIESSPNLAYVWGKYEQNVIEYDKEWELLCFAYKWQGEKKVKALGRPDFKGDEEKLVKALWNLFNEADILIGHNSDRFDIRKANAKFLEYGLTPPSFYKTVDTLKLARKYFMLNSNKLTDVGNILNVGKKLETGGFALWLGCMNDDKKSWKKMLDYNKQDVVLTELVYDELKVWHVSHPNFNVIAGTTHNCPTCGSDKTQKRGFAVTRVGKNQRYACQSCGAWSTGERIKIDKPVLR